MDTCRDWLGMCTASIYRYVTHLFQPTWLWVSITVNPMCKKHFFGWNHSQDFPTFPNLSWPTNLTLTPSIYGITGMTCWKRLESPRHCVLRLAGDPAHAVHRCGGRPGLSDQGETDRDGDVGTRWEHVGTRERAGSPQQFWDLYGFMVT